ncbi:hypothetical protein CDD80_7216 [Ophiocordyceps camponoti-rufipedis]|uniref:CRIB domain-containing protein n=1 Tax=Ophiocordyceps camponoti-rufipedis TaxID=2004952 RepID=A0A2C5ZFJ0_9HYPO|nr:hypothetical protein CDD80_7216 [Ophiocordyceps camponoti-rufipedis]
MASTPPHVYSPPDASRPDTLKSFRPLWRSHMRRVSRFPRDREPPLASSESSSQASITCEDLSLSRRSSTDSSSAPSQHRPESLRAFGKILFHRRAKSKRDGLSRASSTSSSYSVDASPDSSDFSLPAFFSRRKPSRQEPSPRKLQISGPFNFQHLAHRTRAHHLAETSRMCPAHDAPSSLSLDVPQRFRPPLLPRKTAPSTGPSFLQQGLSPLSQLHQAVPAMAHGHAACSAVASSPPPCQPIRRGLMDSSPPCPVERPRTGGSYLRLQPLCLRDLERDLPPLPAGTSAHLPPGEGQPQQEEDGDEDGDEESPRRDSSARPVLSSAGAASSFRPWQTLPSTSCWHRSSVSSDTLGRLDGTAARTVTTAGARDELALEAILLRGSWEDDIDYCYEHEAEANCDYPWDRPSSETARDTDPLPPVAAGRDDGSDSPVSVGSGAPSFEGARHLPPSPSLSAPGSPEHEALNEAYRGLGLYNLGGQLPLHQRSSASTMTDSSCGSDSTEKRHMSNASSRTTLTRRTTSSSSLDKWASESVSPMTTSPAVDAVPDLVPFCDADMKRGGHHKSHASESLVTDEPKPMAHSWPRRRRAMTATSPVEQCYALFPRVQAKGSFPEAP